MIGSDTRKWYAVVRVVDGEVTYCGPCDAKVAPPRRLANHILPGTTFGSGYSRFAAIEAARELARKASGTS